MCVCACVCVAVCMCYQSSSEMMIPVLELLTLYFGKGHVSELNILENAP